VSLQSPEMGAQAPLRVLEDPSLRNIWRNGEKIRPHIRLVKQIVYAVDRRVRGVPRNAAEADSTTQHEAMTFEQACADLEEAARGPGAGDSASSMSQMARDVVPTLLEFNPAEYEQYCAKAGIPLYSSSPADPPADRVQGRGPAASMAAAGHAAGGLPGAEEPATTSAQHAGGAGYGSSPLTQRRLSLVSTCLQPLCGSAVPVCRHVHHNITC
jgi:hypothetical protein